MTSYKGLGNLNDGRPFWIGNFSQADQTEVLFYYPGDDKWWLGSYDGNQLNWTLAGNTAGFGHEINDGRPFWIGDFNGDGRSDILFYYPGDDNWWLGSYDENQLNWTLAGNTAGFGHEINDGRPFWIGNFSRADRTEVLFYYPGDGNWWLGSYDGNQLNWSLSGNTGGPVCESVVVHFKSLVAINNNINNFINDQFAAMYDLFVEGGIVVHRGTTEDLSNDQNLQPLQNINVEKCLGGQLTQDQITLFDNRNYVSNDELVIYIVSTIIGGNGNFVGCASHPAGQPGAVVVQTNERWLVAHEVGHVLGLSHIDTNSDLLMWEKTNWTNLPPDLTDYEYSTMLDSNLSHPC